MERNNLHDVVEEDCEFPLLLVNPPMQQIGVMRRTRRRKSKAIVTLYVAFSS